MAWIGNHIEEAFKDFGERSWRWYRPNEKKLYSLLFRRNIVEDRKNYGDGSWRLLCFSFISHSILGFLLYLVLFGGVFGVLAILGGTAYKEIKDKGHPMKRVFDWVSYNWPGVAIYGGILWIGLH